MIIIGYPGIGKSTLAGRESGCIDLESSDFKELFPVGQWVAPYCTMAENLAKQGFTVFVSSHEAVRSCFYFRETKDLGFIYPSLKMRKEWIYKLLNRADDTKLEKDIRAYKRAEACYLLDIKRMREMAKHYPHCEIESLDYDLLKMVDTLERKNKRGEKK